MTFLQPWWWLLALLSLPLILWFGRRPRSVVVGSLRIWRDIVDTSRSPRTTAWRPRLTLPLVLLLASLWAITVALVGVRPSEATVDHRIFLIDRTASMSAASGNGTRFDHARAQLLRELALLEPQDRGGPYVSVIVVGHEIETPIVRHPNHRHARRVIENLTPTVSPDEAPWFFAADVTQGLRVDGEATQVTVVTDGEAKDRVHEAFPEGLPSVDVLAFGESVPSIGLALGHADLLDDNEKRFRIEGEVVAFPPPDEPVAIRAFYTRDDLSGTLPWGELSVQVDRERTPFRFDTTIPAAGLLKLEISGSGLPFDDSASVHLRTSPLPLYVLTVGDVPQPLIDAIGALEGVTVSHEPDGGGRYDLAIVAGTAHSGRRPAPTVIWTQGASPNGVHEQKAESIESAWPGRNLPDWSSVTDFNPAMIGTYYSVPALEGFESLLTSTHGPLIQVQRAGDTTDVVIAWNLGASSWSQELGFVRLLSEVARTAKPRHGSYVSTRCIVGRDCPVPDVRAVQHATLGLHGSADHRWVMGTAASAESNLQVAGVPSPSTGFHIPWRRLDQGLVFLAAALLTIEGALSFWRSRPLRATHIRMLMGHAMRFGAVVALVCLGLGVPLPVPTRPTPPVLVATATPWARVEGAQGSDEPSLSNMLDSRDFVVTSRRFGFVEPASPETIESWQAPPFVGGDSYRALRLASGMHDPGGFTARIIATGLDITQAGRASEIAMSLSRQGITVDVLREASPSESEAWIEPLSIPRSVRAGDTIEVRAIPGGPAADRHNVLITITNDTETDVSASGPSGVNVLEWTPERPGEYEIRAELTDAGGISINDVRPVIVQVAPAGNVVLMSSDVERAQLLLGKIQALGFEATVRSPTSAPVRPEDWMTTDAVILDEVPAVEFHTRQQEALERWVREYGGGVFVAGAEHAFGPGGYYETRLETMSPLSARVPGEQPQAAVAFVIDRSGSMQQATAGITRLDVAKQATLSAVQLLHPSSVVSVVVFDDVATLLHELGPPVGLASALGPVSPGGGTNLYPALESAFAQLVEAEAEAKHMIVLTDGLAQAASFDPLVAQIGASGITVSTVSIGSGAGATLLQRIARTTGGAFHESSDIRSLPSILSQEAILLSGSPIREGSILPTWAPGDEAFATDIAGPFPSIGGFVRTTPRPEATMHAEAPSGDPLLASWRHGVGRVVALATPVTGPWSTDWLETTFAEDLLANVLRWLRPPITPPGLALEVYRELDELVGTALLIDDAGREIEGARLEMHTVYPSGKTIKLPMADIGSGRYRARVPAHDVGRYRVTGVGHGVERSDTAIDTSLEVQIPFPHSLAAASSRPDLLAFARATGGELLSSESLRMQTPGLLRWTWSESPGVWALAAIVLTLLGLAVLRSNLPIRRTA